MDDSAPQRLLTRLEFARDSRFTVVGEAGNADDAVASVRRLQPDVVLLDVEMPGVSGPAAFPRIVEACPFARVVALTHLDPAAALALFPLPRPVGVIGKSLFRSLPSELVEILQGTPPVKPSGPGGPRPTHPWGDAGTGTGDRASSRGPEDSS